MCGIIGYVGKEDAVPVLLRGLKSLEYRGYDSSGIAVHNGANLSVTKRAGRLANLENALAERPIHGHCGIGHTRWATHGLATDTNAHPFVSSYGKFAVVHNGIISNYLAIAAFLRERGVSLLSDTDSEVVAHLIDYYYTGDVLAALCRAVSEIRGSFALGVISVFEPNTLYGVRKNSPLIVGKGDKSFSLCSDVSAISDLCDEYCPLENDEIVKVDSSDITLYDFSGEERPLSFLPTEDDHAQERKLGEDRMLAEIRETPLCLLSDYESFSDEDLGEILGREYRDILILGCGSAYHAGLIFQAAMREWLGIHVRGEIASEYLIRRDDADAHTLVIAVSQSGETADTLLAINKAKRAGATVLSVCNVRASSLVRLSDCAIITKCGRECAVAATKSYVSQAYDLLLLCLKYAEIWGKMSNKESCALREELAALPDKISEILREESYISLVAERAKDADAIFYLGRNADYCAAREASLKLKEVSYLFSEAYPSGELKHGTLALMDRGIYGVIVATDPSLVEKNASTLAEITCRGASSVVVTLRSLASEFRADYVIALPDTRPLLSSLISAVPLQLFAYFVAKARGCDVDKPRNLAKSVTVE